MASQIIPAILFIFCLIIKYVNCIVQCGKPMCFSTKKIMPGEQFTISWHRMDITNKIQLSLLYGDTISVNDCHQLNDESPLLHWIIDDKSEEYNITIKSVDFDVKDKSFIFLLNYLSVDTCMMGPEGSGESFITIDETMKAQNQAVINPDNTNGNSTDNNNNNNDMNGDPNKINNSESDKDSNSFPTGILILILIIGIIIILCILWFYLRKVSKNKKEDVKSSSRNLPGYSDDAFTEGSVYSAVNINNAIPSTNDSYVNNVSVESFNSANSQSGLISRHEAKMIAERFRRELQNPLNNEVEEASSIKGKEEV